MIRSINKTLLLWLSDTQGVTGIEYGLILGGVSLGIGTGVFMFGDSFSNLMSDSFGDYVSKGLGE
jgi:Flp pilus assembly pilin Flp